MGRRPLVVFLALGKQGNADRGWENPLRDFGSLVTQFRASLPFLFFRVVFRGLGRLSVGMGGIVVVALFVHGVDLCPGVIRGLERQFQGPVPKRDMAIPQLWLLRVGVCVVL